MIHFLFLPMLFFIGVVASYGDFRDGKIRNRWILLGLGWGAACLSFLFILKTTTDTDIVSLQYFGRVLENFILAVAVSFAMWKFNVWSAGDAKLFIVFSLLIPVDFYWKSYLPIFPSFALLVNIFFIVLVYLFARAVIFSAKYFYLKAFHGSSTKLDGYRGFPLDFNEFTKLGGQTPRGLMVFPIAGKLLKGLFKFHNINTGKEKIGIDQLSAGMTLGQNFINQKFKEEIIKSKEDFGAIRIEGLNDKQVVYIKKWAQEKNIQEVKVYKAFPFASWMFAGVILTLAIKMSIINLLVDIWKSWR